MGCIRFGSRLFCLFGFVGRSVEAHGFLAPLRLGRIGNPAYELGVQHSHFLSLRYFTGVPMASRRLSEIGGVSSVHCRIVVVEAHGFLAPLQADDAGGAGAGFGDDDFGQAGAVFRVVGVGAVHEHHDVGVLFDGPKFHASVELRQGDQR